MEEPFEERFGAYLSRALDVEVVRIKAHKILGGASRETWDVHVDFESRDGTPEGRDLVFRLDPEQSLLPSNRQVEFAVYRAFDSVNEVPVPEVLFIEDDASALGYPFFVMRKVEGIPDMGILYSARCDAIRPAIGRQMMEILGRIAAADHLHLGLDAVLGDPRPDEVWALQLEYWEKVLHDNSVGAKPVTEATIRWLRRNPPPPPERVSVVHGDYRVGNFLYTDKVEAILDWEMVHLGDAHEDLAWAFDPMWGSPTDSDLDGALLDRESAIAYWESTSGLRFNPEAMAWWEVFIHVKSLAIWMTGFLTETYRFAFIHWMLADREELWMLEKMKEAR